MTRGLIAKINPQMLIWARNRFQLDIEHAAQFLGVEKEQIACWESGEEMISISKMRKVAAKYRLPFAAFYLSATPSDKIPEIKDYRRLSSSSTSISIDLSLEIIDATEKRDIMLEIYDDLGTKPGTWELDANLTDDPEEVGIKIRNYLGITYEQQRNFRERRNAFSSLRSIIEKAGIMVLQATSLELNEMRGMSIASFPLPVVIINRKDSYSGRIFSLFHEIVHIMLRNSGICDMSEGRSSSSDIIAIETFCNRVAGAALIPEKDLLERGLVKANPQEGIWEDDSLEQLSDLFAVSKEAILYRMVVLGLTSLPFYTAQRGRFHDEYSKIPRNTDGFVPPALDSISSSGKLFTDLVLNAYSANKITSRDVSEYLGVRTKHFNRIIELLGNGGKE